MISVKKAKELISQNSNLLDPEVMNLQSALGYIISEDIISPISMPPFNQSAMDGYAIGGYINNNEHKGFEIIGELQAGDSSNSPLEIGRAYRIFTGAMVPEDTMSVIMQEVTSVEEGKVIIQSEIIKGSNIRLKGEQIKKGDVALQKCTKLTAAGIGFLAGLGITQIKVFPKPKIGIIVTGNELTKPGEELKPGRIYESNSATIQSALESTQFKAKEVKVIGDSFIETVEVIKSMMENMDVLIISGGISVGDYDFVGKALEELKTETVFYKIKQKPGKPIFFGKKNNCLVFALPGNPSATLLCYYQYVLPTLRIASGTPSTSVEMEKRMLRMKNSYVKKGDRTHFLKAKLKENEVEALEGQSSAMLHTFAIADALIFVPENKNSIEAGELVEVHIIP